MLAAATDRAFPILVFALGLLASALSARAIQVTHDYYRAARGRVSRFEDRLGLPDDERFDTTAGLRRAGRSVPVNATAVTYLLLAGLAVADVAGIVTVALR